jgi:hypothetical protein
VAQGTHTGIIAGEFLGDGITAVALPTISGPGTGTPKISKWVSCAIGSGFMNGFDPHTVTAYASLGGTFPAGDALAVLADWGTVGSPSGTPPGRLAVVDLTRMLNPTFVPVTGNVCNAGPLPTLLPTGTATAVVAFVAPCRSRELGPARARPSRPGEGSMLVCPMFAPHVGVPLG